MSDLMLYGVLRMPYDMAMSGELSRRQFWSRVQEAANRLEAAEAELSRRAAQPADVGAGDMPEPFDCVDMASGDTKFVYSADQMRQYARDAIAADRRRKSDTGIPASGPQAAQGVSVALIMSLAEQAKKLPDLTAFGPIALTPIQIAFVAGKLAELRAQLAQSEASVAAYQQREYERIEGGRAAPPLSSEQQAEKGADACGS